MKIVVVSPHRDDAAFSLALAIGRWIEAGHKVIVVNCFSRSATAPYAEMDFVHSNDRMSFVTALRGREDETWRRRYGAALSLVDLNMKDAPLRLHCEATEVYGLTVDVNDKAMVKIQKAVERIGAAVVVLPLGLGGHIDHLTAREALGGSGLPRAYYEDLPVASGAENIEPVVRDLERTARIQLTPAFASEPIDAADAVARKRRAALCYDSQVDDPEVERIANFGGRYQGRERLWVDQAWRNCGLVAHDSDTM